MLKEAVSIPNTPWPSKPQSPVESYLGFLACLLPTPILGLVQMHNHNCWPCLITTLKGDLYNHGAVV